MSSQYALAWKCQLLKVVDSGRVPPHTVPMSRARRQKQRRERQTVKLTQGQIRKQIALQRKQAKERLERKAAYNARNTYKPRKKDRGKLVFIGTKGQKDPQRKGRKGYLLYVTKTGKKWLVKQVTNKRNTSQFRPRKLSSIAPRETRATRNAAKKFEAAKLVKVSTGKAATKGAGTVGGSSGAYDFSDKVVEKIAKSLKTTIERQASHRSFLISAMVLVRLPDGTQETVEVQLPIDKADHIAIKLGGLINFVRHKFYAFMARELAHLGYVTVGSSNHIRRLPDNDGAEPGEYVDKTGKEWHGNDLDVVRILKIDWQIQQAK